MDSAPQEYKTQAIARLLEELRAAREAGKLPDDHAAIAAHPELMPELGEALTKQRQADPAGNTTNATLTMEVSQQGPAGQIAELQRPAIVIPGYSMVKEISRGGQGVVYLAVQLSTGRKVAVKVMREGPLADDRSMARFQREVQVLAALNHPNIVNIIDTGMTPDGSRYLVMNYIAGSSLNDYMKRRHRKDHADPGKLLRTFLKICDAVNEAHLRGIVHRDLKPSNIRVDERGEPHVLDFGLARAGVEQLASGAEPVSVTGEFLGSLPWSSPEQAEGDPSKIDTRTDVYALGVILYQMLTGGRFPYEVVGNIRNILNNILTVVPKPPSEVLADLAAAKAAEDKDWAKRHEPPVVNEGIERVVLKALSKTREKRYQTAGELGKDVANYLRGLPTGQAAGAPAAGTIREATAAKSGDAATEPAAADRRSWKGAAAVAAAFVLLVCGLAVWRFLPAGRKSTPLAASEAAADRWEPLFNGVDLTAWHAGQGAQGGGTADWNVTDGVLTGEGRTGIASFRTDKGDYGDFRLRAVTRLCQAMNYVRTTIGLDSETEDGFQVAISNTHPDSTVVTGEIRTLTKLRAAAKKVDLKPNEWFTMEIVHTGRHLSTLINGVTVSECDEPSYAALKGPIVILVGGGETLCEFKSIEIQEIAPTAPGGDAAPFVKGNAPPPFVTGHQWQTKDGEMIVEDTNNDGDTCLFGDPAWTDYDLNMDVMHEFGDMEAGVVFRSDVDGKNSWRADIGAFNSNKNFDLLPVAAGKAGWDDSARRWKANALPGVLGTWYTVSVKVRGSGVEVYVDGIHLASSDDGRFFNGRVGMHVQGSGRIRFRNVEVRGPSGELLWRGLPVLQKTAPPPARAAATASGAGLPHNLLQGLDPHAAAVFGTWEMKDNQLVGSGNPSRMEFPVIPPAEYDYRIVFTRTDGWSDLSMICAHGDHQFEFGVSGGGIPNPGRFTGLALVNGLPFAGRGSQNNPTVHAEDNLVPNNVEHTAIVRVRNDHVEALLDGRTLVNFKTDYQNLAPPPYAVLPHPNTLGLAFSTNTVTIRVAELVDVGGNGPLKKLAVPATNSGRIDLLKLVDLQKDVVAGQWNIIGDDLVCRPLANARVQFPYVPPAEYDYRLVFTRTSGSTAVSELLAKKDRSFEFIVGGWGNTVAGFGNIGGVGAVSNRTGQKSAAWLSNDHQYTLLVTVRKDAATAFLDGVAISNIQTNYQELSMPPEMALPRGDALGVMVYNSNLAIHAADVLEITGRGQLLRGAKDTLP